MKPTISLAVPHAHWVGGRSESLDRLLDQLGLGSQGAPVRYPAADLVVATRLVTDRAPNHEWSLSMWAWGARQKASHFLQLQDDVIVAPNFWPALAAMLEAVPDEVIGLEAARPEGPMLAAEGHRWYTTSDFLVGVQYALPTALLAEFLEWRSTRLKPGAVEKITEDTMIGLWCLATARRIWHPIPAIADHDTSLASTYGNDAHENRRPSVTWKNNPYVTPDVQHDALEEIAFWLPSARGVPHLGRAYGVTPAMLREHVVDLDPQVYARALRDTGRPERTRLMHAMRARRTVEPLARVMLCTPNLGTTHPEYNAAVWKLSAISDVEFTNPFEVDSVHQWSGDVVRVRSRFVRAFLESDATHLLFVDADVSFEPQVVVGMLAAKQDFVAAPYPKRMGVDWKRALADDGRPPEARAFRWPITALAAGLTVDHETACANVAGIGLGCALLSRNMLQAMVLRYGEELTFLDVHEGQRYPTVALFQLMIRDGQLLSEDHSFARRWTDMGGTVAMYLGPGSPVTHHGDFTYRGVIEAFGLTRVESREARGDESTARTSSSSPEQGSP